MNRTKRTSRLLDLCLLVFGIPVVIAAIIFVPLALIWSLNTLFGLTIPWTFKTWFAALVLGAVASGSSRGSR